MVFIRFYKTEVNLIIWLQGCFSSTLCQELNLCSGGASFAGGHSQEEVLHASPQHCVLGNLPQAPVQLFHLLVLAFDVCGGAEGVSVLFTNGPANRSPENHVVT